MPFKSLTLAAAAAFALTSPAFAESKIMIKDAYARGNLKVGAAFLEIHNMGDTDDRLIEVRTEIAAKNELHTHKDMGDGVMKMMHVEEGFEIPAGGMHALKRGGDHLMFMGLTNRLEQGDTIDAVLVFEEAGEIEIAIPVDQEREADHGDHGSHGKHSDDAHKHH